MILGMFDFATYDQETLTLEPGDTLVVFSDGISEAQNPAGEEYGDDRLIACLEANRGAAPAGDARGAAGVGADLRGRRDAERRHDGAHRPVWPGLIAAGRRGRPWRRVRRAALLAWAACAAVVSGTWCSTPS